jgi:tetratricopeptide (TPR) repeat protein
MQNTASLWVLLCEELEARRADESASEHSAAARKFEEAARQVFQKHPARLRDAFEIAGDIHQAAKADADARRCFQEALAVETPTAAQSGRLATKLALVCESAGDVTSARRYYEMAVEAHDRGADHSGLATLLNNLGALHRLCGDLPAAEKAYHRALAEAAATHGSNHPEVALIANNLGVAYTDIGNLAKAEEAHLHALQIRELIFGANHPDVGQSLANLGVVYHARGEHMKAERFYRGAIDTLSHFVAAEDPEMERITSNLNRLPHVHVKRLSKTTRL